MFYSDLCSCFTVVNITCVGLALVEFRDQHERQRLNTNTHTNTHTQIRNIVIREKNGVTMNKKRIRV